MSVKTKTFEAANSYRPQILGGLVILCLSIVTIFPLLATFALSVYADGTSLISGFSLANWEQVLAENRAVLGTTVVYAFGAATLTTTLGVFLAWAIARTNIPLRRTYYYVVFGMLFLPPVVWEAVWIRLLSTNGFYQILLPFDFHIYSLPGMILVQGIFMLPLTLIVLMPMYKNIDNSLEEASRINGGGVLQTTWSVTLPLMKPGILAAFLLVLVLSLGSLRVPLLIGQPGNIYVLPTVIYQDAINAPIQFGSAFVNATLLILFAFPVFYLYKRVLGQTSRYETVGGEAFKQTPIELERRYRYGLSGVIGFTLLAIVITPVLVMVHGSLSPYLIPFHRVFTLEAPLALDQYRALVTDSSLHEAALNSLIAAGSATILTVGGAITISWIIYKSDLAFREAIDYISFLPIALTAVSLSLGFIAIFLGIFPIGIYGTLWIIILAYLTRSLPTTIRVVAPSVQQLQNELFEAGVISGASKLTRLRTILVPLIITTIHAIGAWRFAILYKEFPISILLEPSDFPLLAPYIFELGVQANFPRISAIGVAITVFLAIVTVLIHRIPASGGKL
ncbi:ABC transporter permease [Natrarchaeobius oligotrophus]|uniref:Iron ABC transporter permease n=1 Tax=Natrarchaeobius chitinivorans TaxID=1679083 RepID=A0A3N6PSR5_NATCH|nr:ABC transporter permease subunit [Natrarchaeobius chitinivorans]RQH02606.1 iron ABC transporter permease [Natrarchaeobius chitinivorans]